MLSHKSIADVIAMRQHKNNRMPFYMYRQNPPVIIQHIFDPFLDIRDCVIFAVKHLFCLCTRSTEPDSNWLLSKILTSKAIC